jgi:hypothetical protein
MNRLTSEDGQSWAHRMTQERRNNRGRPNILPSKNEALKGK